MKDSSISATPIQISSGQSELMLALRNSTELEAVAEPGLQVINLGANSTTFAQWDGLRLEHSLQPPNENIYRFSTYTVIVSLGPTRFTQWRFDGSKLEADTIVPGCISIFAPGQELWVRWHKTCENIVLTLDDAALLRTSEMFQIKGGISLGQEPVIDDPLVVQMAQALKREAMQSLPNSSLYGDQMSAMLLHHLLKNYPDRTRQSVFFRGGMTPRNLRQVTDYVEEHLHEDIKLVELASLVAMTPQHFSRCFREEMGLPPYRYVLKQRLARAKDLLRQTKLSIGDIALAVGYDSPSHFGKLFRQACGITPNQYRRGL